MRKLYPVELKDYASMLKSVQKYIEKGWHPFSVDLVSMTIQLYNPNAPYRKQNKYKRMSRDEKDFINAISYALGFLTEESILPMIAAIIQNYSSILIPYEEALKDYPELLKRVKEIEKRSKERYDKFFGLAIPMAMIMLMWIVRKQKLYK